MRTLGIRFPKALGQVLGSQQDNLVENYHLICPVHASWFENISDFHQKDLWYVFTSLIHIHTNSKHINEILSSYESGWMDYQEIWEYTFTQNTGYLVSRKWYLWGGGWTHFRAAETEESLSNLCFEFWNNLKYSLWNRKKFFQFFVCLFVCFKGTPPKDWFVL